MSAPEKSADTAQRWSWSWVGTSVTAFLLLVWEFALWAVAFVALPVLIVMLIAHLAIAVWTPPSWYYSISARSEAAELALPAERETSWRIEGATLCSTATLEALSDYLSKSSPCGSRRWHAYSLPDAYELVLVLGGRVQSPKHTIEVVMDTHTGSGLHASIRGGQAGRSLGKLRLVDEGIEVPLGPELNLFWASDARPRDLVFPFIANRVRIGRDVTWSDSSLLHQGRMEIFSSSDENPSKRTRIEEAELLPGDQVNLDLYEGKTMLQPKGFFRFDRLQQAESPSALYAVAFGRAEKVRIERFGDSGYDFQPSLWARFFQNSTLVTLTGIIVGLLSLLGGYGAIRDIHANSPKCAFKEFKKRCERHQQSSS
ncbi:MAG: hypothetical protein R6W97_06325 [Thiobacillus sp.]